jgi:hypothetical protein
MIAWSCDAEQFRVGYLNISLGGWVAVNPCLRSETWGTRQRRGAEGVDSHPWRDETAP